MTAVYSIAKCLKRTMTCKVDRRGQDSSLTNFRQTNGSNIDLAAASLAEGHEVKHVLNFHNETQKLRSGTCWITPRVYGPYLGPQKGTQEELDGIPELDLGHPAIAHNVPVYVSPCCLRSGPMNGSNPQFSSATKGAWWAPPSLESSVVMKEAWWTSPALPTNVRPFGDKCGFV